MERIDKILDEVLKKRKIKQKLKEVMLKEEWHNIVGKDLSKVCYPKWIKNDIIFIKCVNSAWAQEVSLIKDKLKNKINSYLEEDRINKIFITS